MQVKDPNAVALGRKGGAKGGKARAAKMTPKQRSEAARKAARARWDMPEEVARGELRAAGGLACFVLDDERRVLSQSGMIAAMGMSSGSAASTGLSPDRLVRFTQGQRISAFVPPSLVEQIRNPIKFRMRKTVAGRQVAHGYEATVLVDLCTAVVRASEAGVLQHQQMHIARACTALITAFAKVGIVALVDEATGYQYHRARNALAKILEKWIAKELAEWVKRFPDRYYERIAELKGWTLDPDSTKRPSAMARVTDNIIYRRLAPGVLQELRKRNPTTSAGQRRHKHHQYLTTDHGVVKFREHMTRVMTLLEVSPDWRTFTGWLDQQAPMYGQSLLMEFMAPERRMKIEAGQEQDTSW